MPLDFTEHYRLRKPKITDTIDETDFNRFFSGNQDLIDAELYRLSNALSDLSADIASLESADNPASASDLNDLRSDLSALRLSLSGYANRIAALETNGAGGSGNADSSGIASLNAAISAMQTTLAAYGERIANLEQNGTNSDADNVNLTALENRIAELESGAASLAGVSGRLANLESALGTLSGRVNVLESAVNAGSGTGTGGRTISADASAQIQALQNSVQADMTLLSNRLLLLESAAFTDFREGDDGYWYAYNKSGVQVDGPLKLGYLNGGKTWADIFGIVEDSDLPPESDDPTPAPRTWAQVFGIDE